MGPFGLYLLPSRRLYNEVHRMHFFWSNNRHRIRELSAADMAGAATLLSKSGRRSMALRFTYHALVLNPYEPTALCRLAAFIDDNAHTQSLSVEHLLAALVLEYGLRSDSLVPFEQKRELERSKAHRLEKWTKAAPPLSARPIASDAIEESLSRQISEMGYTLAVNQAANKFGSYQKAFRIAHTLLGLNAGLLRSKIVVSVVSPFEVQPSDYRPTTVYQEWLQSESGNFKQLERSLH